jgi:hypothetical protein
MQGAARRAPGASFEVGPREGIEYVLAFDQETPAAVFLIVGGTEIHFCFVPAFWGRSEPIARGFIAWLWENSSARLYKGPVPVHNRLALQLAKRVGFTEQAPGENIVMLEIRKP